MASNAEENPVGETNADKESGSHEQSALALAESVNQAEQRKHRFSEPWEDSDLILVVEDEKFHVHRVILSMNSPVFKAMFKSQFKEATSNEIPLPEKKANEVLDFLKHIYYQHIQEPVEISMENVEHLFKLSDEYQVKLIYEPCRKFVENQPKTKQNVMKIRKMAEMYNLDNVHQDCDKLLKDMNLKTLSETVGLEDLDRENVLYFLSQRIERLEKLLVTLYPQFIGVVSYMVWLLNKVEDRQVKPYLWCKEHCSKGYCQDPGRNLGECSQCCKMIESISQNSEKGNRHWREYHYGGYQHFDEKLSAVIKDLRQLKLDPLYNLYQIS